MGDFPQLAGVYIFKDKEGRVIYVGKAKNLRKRLLSYKSNNLSPKTAIMVKAINKIDYIPVENEIEALLLEAKLVRKFSPKYNIQLKDDKSPLYVGITKEDLPRVVLLRQREIDKYKLQNVYGPFISSNALRRVLKMIKRVFPYGTHKPAKRVCVYNQIGLCNPCPSEVGENEKLKEKYLLNIKRVNTFFSGKSNLLIKQLEGEMKIHIEKENYEEARELKRKLDVLVFAMTRKDLDDGYLENPNLLQDIRKEELKSLAKVVNSEFPVFKIKIPLRIECFDVAHLSGSFPTASMVTFVKGEPDKSFYRHFRLHNKNSDVDNMKEVLKRRFSNLDWGKPDLIIVDGGKPQISAALEVVKNLPVVGLAKREEKLVFKTSRGFKEIKVEGHPKNLLQRIRDEAHRFARRYHHKLVKKAIIGVGQDSKI